MAAALFHQIHLLNNTRRAVLIQVYTAGPHLPQLLIAGGCNRKRGVCRIQVDGTDTGIGHRNQLIFSIRGFGPDRKIVKNAVSLIDPAVAVLIVFGEFGKPIALCRSEELTPLLITPSLFRS